MKTLKNTFAILLAILILSCSKDKETTTPDQNTIPAGTADIKITAGQVNKTIVGTCGWSNVQGVNFVAAKDNNNSTRILNIDFNIPAPPSETTTYIIKSASDNSTDPKHVKMSFTEIVGNTLFIWNSNTDLSLFLNKQLKVVVEGNKVSIDLNGITLKAQTDAGLFTNGNVGEFAKVGELTGTLIFYK